MSAEEGARDHLAMNRGVAEVRLTGKCAAMIQVHVMLPGETDTAVDLDSLGSDVLSHIGGIRFRHRYGGQRFVNTLVHGPAGVVGEGTRVLDRDHHIDALVLDGLKGANGLAELDAGLRVLDRYIEGLLCG